MKAILINSKDKTVTEIEISEKNTLADWYKAIGCNLVQLGAYINQYDDSIMVDEEGLLNLSNQTTFFEFEGAHQPFCGNGLIVGVDDEGESVSCKISALEVSQKVSFKSYHDLVVGDYKSK